MTAELDPRFQPAQEFTDAFNGLMRDLTQLDKLAKQHMPEFGRKLFVMMLVSTIEATSRLLISHINLTISVSGHRGAITEDEFIASFCEELKIEDEGTVQRVSLRVPPKALVKFSLTWADCAQPCHRS
jgi:hypothetical protein